MDSQCAYELPFKVQLILQSQMGPDTRAQVLSRLEDT